MQTVAVREKLHQMHQKYLDDANTKPCAKLSEEDAEKILTIKKKLASLEKNVAYDFVIVKMLRLLIKNCQAKRTFYCLLPPKTTIRSDGLSRVLSLL